MILPIALAILVHRHVQDPVQPILDTPLRTRHFGEPRGRKRRAQQIIRAFRGGLAFGLARPDHLADRCQTRPRMLLQNPVDVSGDLTGPGLDAAMIGIDRRVSGFGRPSRVVQKQPDVIVQASPDYARRLTGMVQATDLM